MSFVQALPGGEQGSGTVGVDGTAFQREIDLLALCAFEYMLCIEGLDQPVVATRLELAAPAGEAEVEQLETLAPAQGYRTRIAQPGIVVFHRHEADPRHVGARRTQARRCT